MKRSFRRARKSYRPKKTRRYFKARIRRSRYNRPDVGYSEKVVFTRNMIVDAQNNFTWFNFHWMATGNSGAHDVYFNDQTQFN